MLQIYKQNVIRRLIYDYVNGDYVLINCKLLKGASVNCLTCWEVSHTRKSASYECRS